jgi:GTP-binding protein
MQIISATFLTSSPKYENCPPADHPEFVFIGRSNVGKSSLINSLCGKKWLAKISMKPGKTQLINHFSITSEDAEKNTKNRYLVDLPGYGYAKVAQKSRLDWEDMITDYLLMRPNIAEIFVLVDSSIKPQAIDLGFINRLYENQLHCTIVFTKSDKATQKALNANIKAFATELTKKIHPHPLPWFFITSSEKRQSTTDLLKTMHELV